MGFGFNSSWKTGDFSVRYRFVSSVKISVKNMANPPPPTNPPKITQNKAETPPPPNTTQKKLNNQLVSIFLYLHKHFSIDVYIHFWG